MTNLSMGLKRSCGSITLQFQTVYNFDISKQEAISWTTINCYNINGRCCQTSPSFVWIRSTVINGHVNRKQQSMKEKITNLFARYLYFASFSVHLYLNSSLIWYQRTRSKLIRRAFQSQSIISQVLGDDLHQHLGIHNNKIIIRQAFQSWSIVSQVLEGNLHQHLGLRDRMRSYIRIYLLYHFIS